MNSNQLSLFGKTSLDASPQKTTPSDASSQRWWEQMPHSFRQEPSIDGTATRTGTNTLAGQTRVWLLDPKERQLGASAIANISEWPNDANVCSLSQILLADVPRKYFLSPKARAGILRRAENRGKELPEQLAYALKAVAGLEQTSNVQGGSSKHEITCPLHPSRNHGVHDTENVCDAKLQRIGSEQGEGHSRQDEVREILPPMSSRQTGSGEPQPNQQQVVREMRVGQSTLRPAQDRTTEGLLPRECNCALSKLPSCGELEESSVTVSDVAWALQERDSKGSDSSTKQWPATLAPTLNAAFGDKMGLEDQHALNGAGLFVPVEVKPTAIPIQNALRGKDQNGLGIGNDGDPQFTLDGGNQHAVAYRTSGNCGVTEQGERTAALNTATDPTQNIVTIGTNQDFTHALNTANNGKHSSEDGTGRGVPTVAFQSSQSGIRTGDVHATLDSNNGSRRHNGVVSQTMVRRLTPQECEMLQAHPLDWTAWGLDAAGKRADQSDSSRYKQLGNGVTVNVLEWIARRISKHLK